METSMAFCSYIISGEKNKMLQVFKKLSITLIIGKLHKLFCTLCTSMECDNFYAIKNLFQIVRIYIYFNIG